MEWRLREQVLLAKTESKVALPPLFRWPGGKRWLVPRLSSLVPAVYGTYYEPFFGAGAFFFSLGPERARISDVNHDLMSCYRLVRDCPTEVAAALRELPTDSDSYYRIRGLALGDEVSEAARFIYLANHAWSGIYRVNRQGAFNVPYGGRRYDGLGSAERLAQYSCALAGAEISTGDFAETLADARSGDFIYLDPPYTVAHSNNGFIKYNARIFSWLDQVRLADTARALSLKGCLVVVSNAYHANVRGLYSGFREVVVSRTSRVAPEAERRKVIQESVFTNVE